MKKEMEDTEVTFFVVPEMNNYETFQENLVELFGAKKFEPGPIYIGPEESYGDYFTLSGNLDDIYDRLINIQTMAKCCLAN